MARIIVPAMDKVAAKWIRRAGSAGEEYRTGIADSRADWAGATAAAAPSYAAGVQEAIASGRFGKGVAQAGNAKWKRMAEEKGTARFGPGVQAAEQDFTKGFAPFLQAIGAVDLPMPGPRGAEGNFQRSQLVGRALNQLRIKK